MMGPIEESTTRFPKSGGLKIAGRASEGLNREVGLIAEKLSNLESPRYFHRESKANGGAVTNEGNLVDAERRVGERRRGDRRIFDITSLERRIAERPDATVR